MDKLYTCEEVAERYGVKISTVWKWIREGKLPAVRLSRSACRVRESDLKEFEESRVEGTAE